MIFNWWLETMGYMEEEHTLEMIYNWWWQAMNYMKRELLGEDDL